MFESCLTLLSNAAESFATKPSIACFRPQTPGTCDGPRIWNTQLLRYAGYRETPESKVLGDPSELAISQFLEKEFGW